MTLVTIVAAVATVTIIAVAMMITIVQAAVVVTIMIVAAAVAIMADHRAIIRAPARAEETDRDPERGIDDERRTDDDIEQQRSALALHRACTCRLDAHSDSVNSNSRFFNTCTHRDDDSRIDSE